jgi:hypothetical protein
MDAGDELSLSFFFNRWTKSSPFLMLLDRVVSLSVMLPGRFFCCAGVISNPIGRFFWLPVGRETTLEDALGVRANTFSLANERRGLLDLSERANALDVSLFSREVSRLDAANTTELVASSRRRFC